MEWAWALPYFVAAMAGHALAARVPTGNPIGKFFLVGTLAGIGLTSHLLVVAGLSVSTPAGLFLYALACELYLFLFIMVASSVSVRLLLLMRRQDLSDREIQEHYQPTGMVKLRIQRLLAAGLLQEAGGHYRISQRGAQLVGLFLSVKHFFRHPPEPSARRAA